MEKRKFHYEYDMDKANYLIKRNVMLYNAGYKNDESYVLFNGISEF